MVKKNMQKYGEKLSNVQIQNTGPYILPGEQCFFLELRSAGSSSESRSCISEEVSTWG